MMNSLPTFLRAALLAVVLAFAAQVANADPKVPAPIATTARTKNDTPVADNNEAPLGGLLIIAGIVVGVVVLAWICSRVSDNRRGNLMS